MAGTYYARAESYSRSYNAMEAENGGRYPLTRAIEVVRREANVTAKAAREALTTTFDGEWHHVGKFASRVDYYDTSAALDLLHPSRVTEREVTQALSDHLAEEALAEQEIEIGWELYGKILRALATGQRAFTIIGKRLVIFAGPDETLAKRYAQRWSNYGREMQVQEVFAS